MERISQAQLNSALTAPASSLQRSLSGVDLSILLAEMDELVRRYPSQDQGESIEAYQVDLEALAVKCSLPRVVAALRELRIRPGQTFFPRPDEVATEIERQQEGERFAAEKRAAANRRQREIEEFWAWAPEWMERTGNDEAELLRRFPSYRGTRI